MIDRTVTSANLNGRLKCGGYIEFGGLCGVARRIAQHQTAEEGAGKGATSAVSRAGDDAGAGQPESLAGGQQEVVVGRVEMTSRGEDSQTMAVRGDCGAGLQGAAGARQIVSACDVDAGENGKLGQVRGDPVDLGKQTVAQDHRAGRIEQFPA